MSSLQPLPPRKEVPEDLTWDLSLIFKSDVEFEAARQDIIDQSQRAQKFQHHLGDSGSTLYEGLTLIFDTFRKLEKVYVYAQMKNDQDTHDNHYQALNDQGRQLFATVSSQLSFLEPELLRLSTEELAALQQAEPRLKAYQHWLTTLLDKKEHTLDAATEALLAQASPIFEASSTVFGILNNSDLEFPFVEDETGQTLQLTHGSYETLIQSTHQDVRREAYESLYSTYRQFRNTFAATLSHHVQAHNFLAQVHHYPSARAAALAGNHIPESVYDTLVHEVNEHLPLLHRYLALRQRLLQLPDLHMYDLYTPLTGEAPLSFTYPEAQDMAKKALAYLGEDYLDHVDEIFNHRYIDVVENQGKRSGAYSGGAYDTPPYELLNWHDDLSNLYTLVHETGHSVHSWYTRHTQPYQYGNYPIFLAEIASTTNENLLTDYFLDHEQDPKIRAFILNHYLDGFKGTVFRQTQFAEFEHFLHTAQAQGTPLTADTISATYAQINAHYYGPNVVTDDDIALEWTRIPHFYYNYYVYQYATGFAAAAALSHQIVTQGTPAVTRYLTYLKAGSSDDAICIMQQAGVDMTQPDYLKAAFATFEQRLNELEKLVQEL